MAILKEDMVRDIALYLREHNIILTQKAISDAFRGEFLSENSCALFGIWSNMHRLGLGWVVARLREHELLLDESIVLPPVSNSRSIVPQTIAQVPKPPEVTDDTCPACGTSDPSGGSKCPSCGEPKDGKAIFPKIRHTQEFWDECIGGQSPSAEA